ncbi:MAG: DedA family protein [Deltaproteobacteria bacterium]|nr:MAG: DedA family protein [Deltaproteobacteria bacterium]
MHWLRRLYDWTLSWAETKYGGPALFVLAFMEASFFPIPPDVLLMALSLSKPKRAFAYALVCTAGSVSGAILGWYIGTSLWASFGIAAECSQYGGGAWLFDHIPGFACSKFGTVEGLYQDNALIALFTAAFTPIPFKIFTVAAGVFHIALPTLLMASFIGRGARFFLVGGLIWKFGPPIKKFIEQRFELLTLVFAILLVGGFVVIKYAF